MNFYRSKRQSLVRCRLGIGLLASSLAITFSLAVTGCGGHRSPFVPQFAESPSPSGQSVGKAMFTVTWPAASRLIPSASHSIVVTITKTDGTPLTEQKMQRPVGGGNTTATFSNLPVGDVIVQVAAHPNTDGSGNTQANASASVTIEAGKTANVALTLASTIDRIEITPTSLNLALGASGAINVAAKNTAGEIVLTDPANLTFASDTPNIATVDSTGKVTAGNTVGTATITVTEKESGKTATVTVRSSDPTAITPIYDGFNYTVGAPLDGQNGGRGWSGAWFDSGPGGAPVIVSGSLSFPHLATSGNAARYPSSTTRGTDRRYPAQVTTPGTVRYWSTLMRPESVTDGWPGPYFGFAVDGVFFGKGSRQTPIGIESIGGGNFTSTGIQPQPNTTYFFVVRVSYNGANDTFDFFVNPEPGKPLPAVPNASQTRPHDSSPETGHGYGVSVPTTVDEMRVGPTWESVSPTIP